MILPQVTILIAHKEYYEYLPKAILSALNQNYPNINICVIDDCSEDRNKVQYIIKKNLFNNNNPDAEQSRNNLLFQKYQNHYAIYILDSSKGPSYARNRGIELTWDSTDVYAILDADDEIYPNKISACMKPIIDNPKEIGIVYGDCDILNVFTNRKVREYREPYDINRLKQECIIHSGSIINKIALQVTKEDTGFYDETMRTCEDYDLWMRISDNFIAVHIPEALTLVRVQPKNSTDTVSKEVWHRNWMRVHQKANAKRNMLPHNSSSTQR